MPESHSKKLFLLDAYALIFRSYYAFIRNPRINSKGQNTSAIFGFVLTLDEILQKQDPSHIAVVFDPPSPTFRHEIFSEYKANRDATPEDIKLSVPYIKALLKAYRIPVYEVEGYEADDVIGTMSKIAEAKGFTTYMMTPDKDFAQLVSDEVKMFKPSRGGNDPEIWGPAEVKEEFLVDDPLQVIDILALMGDSADNIPGAPGVGPKTAKKLISEYGTVEKLLSDTSGLKGKLKEIIENNREQILFSKRLATIETEVPMGFSEEEMERKTPDLENLKIIFDELEFRTLASRMNLPERQTKSNITPVQEAAPSRQGEIQGSLFGDEIITDNRGTATITEKEHHYIAIESDQGIRDLVKQLSDLNEFCFDTETTSIDALGSELVAISFSWEKEKGYLVWFPEDREETRKRIGLFEPVFSNQHIAKVGHNLKFDIQVLGNYGIEVKGTLFDTMIAHYLLEPDMRHKMDTLSEIYLKYRPVPIEDLIGDKGKNQRTMRTASLDKLTEYAVEDADITYQLKELFKKDIEKGDLSDLAYDIEMPLIPVLADMERTGVLLDDRALREYAGTLREEIIGLEKEIYGLAGTEFNISSPKQLGDILFLRLKLDDKVRKTRTKQFSTGEEVLQRLADRHPIINKVLEYRGLRKLLSTYVEALPLLVNPKTGRIHTSYNQAVAATGRLSSNNPNLQNIPIRDAKGREIRKAFIPATGKLFFSADYSQIELRLMAHLSGDAGMREDFLGGQDIHAATASKIFGVKQEEVTREMRTKAKTANFGIIYGISAFGLSQRLNISRTEAKDLIDGYFEGYPGVKSYMDACISKGRENGYVTTIFGRKRYLRDINSRNSLLRSNAERNAINAPIQGAAADIIKIAMIRIHNLLENSSLDAKMIMQVHDELIFEVAEDNINEIRYLVVREMENAARLEVPLVVDSGTGSNWLEAH